MMYRYLFLSLCLTALSGCKFTEQLFDWLEGGSLVCYDIQSQADACWAGIDEEEAESECEDLDWQAAQCSWEASGEATYDYTDTGVEAESEEAESEETGECDALEAYADACWDAAETEEDEDFCEVLELELEVCLDGLEE